MFIRHQDGAGFLEEVRRDDPEPTARPPPRSRRLTKQVRLSFLQSNWTNPAGVPKVGRRMRTRPVHVCRRLASLVTVIVAAALLASVAPGVVAGRMARSSPLRDGFRLHGNLKSLSSGSMAAGCVPYEQASSLHMSLSGRRTVAGSFSAAVEPTIST